MICLLASSVESTQSSSSAKENALKPAAAGAGGGKSGGVAGLAGSLVQRMAAGRTQRSQSHGCLGLGGSSLTVLANSNSDAATEVKPSSGPLENSSNKPASASIIAAANSAKNMVLSTDSVTSMQAQVSA